MNTKLGSLDKVIVMLPGRKSTTGYVVGKSGQIMYRVPPELTEQEKQERDRLRRLEESMDRINKLMLTLRKGDDNK